MTANTYQRVKCPACQEEVPVIENLPGWPLGLHPDPRTGAACDMSFQEWADA